MRKLLEFRRSPNCIKVRIGLNLKGLEYETEEMAAAERAPMIESAGWPLVPVLIDGDVRMRDSAAILHYLDANYRDGAPLVPRDVDTLRAAQRLERRCLGETADIAAALFAELSRPEEERDAERIAEVDRRVDRMLEPLEERLSKSDYLFGQTPTLYDVVLACTIMVLRVPAEFIGQSPMWGFFHQHLSVHDDKPGVRRWYDALIAVDGLRPAE